MDVQSLISGLKKASKKDFIPGTVKHRTDRVCPACGNRIAEMKPCCGSPHGYYACVCGYKINKER